MITSGSACLLLKRQAFLSFHTCQHMIAGEDCHKQFGMAQSSGKASATRICAGRSVKGTEDQTANVNMCSYQFQQICEAGHCHKQWNTSSQVPSEHLGHQVDWFSLGRFGKTQLLVANARYKIFHMNTFSLADLKADHVSCQTVSGRRKSKRVSHFLIAGWSLAIAEFCIWRRNSVDELMSKVPPAHLYCGSKSFNHDPPCILNLERRGSITRHLCRLTVSAGCISTVGKRRPPRSWTVFLASVRPRYGIHLDVRRAGGSWNFQMNISPC